jgi:hypothetical protein
MKSAIRERRRFLTGLAGWLAILPLARSFGSSLMNNFNYSREGKSCALAHFKR